MHNTNSQTIPRLTRQNIIGIIGLLIVGFMFMYFVNSRPITELGGDQIVYNRLSVNMLSGHGFSQSLSEPYTPSIFRTPGYPAFIALVYTLFGKENYDAVRFVQILLMLVASLLLFSISLKLTCNKFCAFGTLALAIFYDYNYSDRGVYGYLLTEALFILVINASVLLLLKLISEKKKRYAILLSCLLTTSMLIRPTNLLFPIGIAFFLLFTTFSRQTLKTVAIIIGGSYLLVAPWTARNYHQFHEFIPLSVSLGGFGVFSGAIVNNPDFFPYPPNMDYRPNGFDISESRKIRARDALTEFYKLVDPSVDGSGGMRIYAIDDSLRQIGMEIICENYWAFFPRWFYRILGHWNLGDCANLINRTKATVTLPDFLKIICKLAILTLVSVGIFRFRKNVLLYAIVLFPAYNTLLYTPFFSHMRYSLPSRGLIIVIGIIGFFEFIRLFLRNDELFATVTHKNSENSEQNYPVKSK